MNPYRYGYPVEVKVNADGSTEVSKHFAMGRSANELSIVMPDQKTVYITDDGTNTMLLMFVADEAGNLDAGTLYAGKWHQMADTPDGGRAWLSWINLGHADRGQHRGVCRRRLRQRPTSGRCSSTTCSTTPPRTRDGMPGRITVDQQRPRSPYQECLKPLRTACPRAMTEEVLAPGDPPLRGAEGRHHRVPQDGRRDPRPEPPHPVHGHERRRQRHDQRPPTYDAGGNNDIRLTANKCGAIYALRLSSRARDPTATPSTASTWPAP
jgi:secreted PhoX family phosphatase